MSVRAEQARLWANRVRRLEPQAMAWVYESETVSADLARRILAQTVGLRRLLDQMVTKENGL
jgi:hypothetical protein